MTKTWKQVIEGMPRLWCKLDISALCSHVKPDFVKRCVRNSGNAVTHVTFNTWNHFAYMSSSQSLGPLLAKCPLQYLRLKSAKYQGTLTRETLDDIAIVSTLKTLALESAYPITIDNVFSMLKASNNLEVAEFHAVTGRNGTHPRLASNLHWPVCPQLKILLLGGSEDFQGSAILFVVSSSHYQLDFTALSIFRLNFSAKPSPISFNWSSVIGEFTSRARGTGHQMSN